MNISLSSTITKNIKESANLAMELNLGMEISRIPNYQNIDTEMNSIIKKLQNDLDGFKNFLTLHGMFFDLNIASKDTAIREISRKRFYQSLEVAKSINAKEIVFHSGNKCMKHYVSQEKFINGSIEFWQEAINDFEKAGITAVIENVHEREPEPILQTVVGVNSPYLKCTLDTGHANLFSKVPINVWIETYGKELIHMHIHNNFNKNDDHNSINNGTIDFSTVFASIKKANINPTIIFETFKKENLIEDINYLKEIYGENICLKN
ncbi:MAG: sugar phosphate isomerase/epimerase [Candidatus Gastranaerophilales bacterium]|nr:sugar phosphate isomerase/epimerase [Candidatus Gastranaerophilales bacterium]